MSAVRILFVLNDPPNGTERSYNGLRLAYALAKREETEVREFLLADSVGCAVAGQKVPEGYYNLGRMIEGLLLGGSASNLSDRLLRGEVTDYIEVGRWPAFNLADVAIVCGVGLLAWILARGEAARSEPEVP